MACCGVGAVVQLDMQLELELSVELGFGFGFYWACVSFFFSSDSRAGLGLGRFGVGFWVGLRARGIFPHRERALHFPGPGPRAPFKF